MLLLLLKFEMNVSSLGCVTYNRGGCRNSESSRQSFKKIVNEILRISIILVLSMFFSWQRNHGKKIGTKKRITGITKERTLVLQASF